MKIASDHGFPKPSFGGSDPNAFDAFKNERDYIAQGGRMETTVAAMDWAAAEIERLRAALRMGLQLGESGKHGETVSDALRRQHAEIERLESELDLFQSIYCEISQIVGRQGTEAHTLAEDVRRAQLAALRAKYPDVRDRLRPKPEPPLNTWED